MNNNLTSQRLTYHQFQSSEYAEFSGWYTNAAVMKNITGSPLTQEEASDRFQHALEVNARNPMMGFFAVRNKETLEFMGIAKLSVYDSDHVEVGYGLLPLYWGKGYASEILSFFVSHARNTLKLPGLLAIVNAQNVASKRVLMKQDFVWWKDSTHSDKAEQFFRLIF